MRRVARHKSHRRLFLAAHKLAVAACLVDAAHGRVAVVVFAAEYRSARIVMVLYVGGAQDVHSELSRVERLQVDCPAVQVREALAGGELMLQRKPAAMSVDPSSKEVANHAT